ncbi:MAG: GNAT family N-acetyltransferase [Acidimicrobiales bacterium]
MSEDLEHVDRLPRRAGPDESVAVTDLWLLCRRAAIPRIPSPAHSDDAVRAWFADQVFPSREVWVVGTVDDLVALMVLGEGWIEQLYVHPAWTSRGIGTRLLDLAKATAHRLDLWTFQANTGARRFYERNGFVATAMTDGDNEEGAPDVSYRWEQR